MMHDFYPEPPTDERTNSDGQKRESHVGSLLFGGRELRNIFVVARRLRDFAEGEDEYGKYSSPITGPEGQYQPRKAGNECAENHGFTRRDLADEVIPGQGKADHHVGVDAEDTFDTSIGVDELVNIAGKRREL